MWISLILFLLSYLFEYWIERWWTKLWHECAKAHYILRIDALKHEISGIWTTNWHLQVFTRHKNNLSANKLHTQTLKSFLTHFKTTFSNFFQPSYRDVNNEIECLVIQTKICITIQTKQTLQIQFHNFYVVW